MTGIKLTTKGGLYCKIPGPPTVTSIVAASVFWTASPKITEERKAKRCMAMVAK